MLRHLLSILVVIVSLNAKGQGNYIKYAKALSQSNDTVIVEANNLFDTYSDVCHLIELTGIETITNANKRILKLYYIDPQFTSGGVPLDCPINDTFEVTNTSATITQIELQLFTIQIISASDTDTFNENSSWFIYFPLNIPEYSGIKEVHLSPNPATNTLNIQVTDKEVIKNISVTDISGRIVFTDNTPMLNNNLYQINATNLPQGMYFLHLANYEGNKRTERFIKTEQ